MINNDILLNITKYYGSNTYFYLPEKKNSNSFSIFKLSLFYLLFYFSTKLFYCVLLYSYNNEF